MAKYNYSIETDYEKYINKIINLLCCNYSEKEISNRILSDIRNYIFNIMITNVSGTVILRDIVNGILQAPLSNEIKSEIILLSSETDHNMIRGRREIIHFDVLIIGILNIIAKKNKL